MENSSAFIDYFNKIELILKKEINTDGYETFSQKVKLSKNKIVIRFKDELLSFADLRNAIVHSPKIGGKVIAEPHKETVDRIKFLYETINNPKKVIPEFQFPVLGAKEDDFINNILIEMREKSFSQFPIFDENNNVVEIITNNTISRWLSKKIKENGTILVENVKVKELISEIEFKNNYKFISKNRSVYEAYDYFIDHINQKNQNLDVIFITETGKEKEKLLGLITIEDIAKWGK